MRFHKEINPKEEEVFLKENMSQFIDIACDGFGTHLTDEDVEEHIFSGEKLFLLYADSCEPVGFRLYSRAQVRGKRVLTLDGVAIKQAAQGKGLLQYINNHIFETEKPDFVVLRTQNPVIYGATKKLVDEIYPGNREPTEIVREVASLLGGPDLPEDFVCRGVYGKSYYPTIPEHSEKKFFDETLKCDYDAGDAVIVVGEVKQPLRGSMLDIFDFGEPVLPRSPWT